MSVVVNLYGGPGTGKSTTMATVFSLMKMRNASVEMSPEWFKTAVWAGENHVLEDQLLLFAKQNHQLRQLDGKVDFIITDAPLLLGLVYDNDPKLAEFVRWTASGYLNVHVFLNRLKPFSQGGRVHDEAQSRKLDRDIREMLRREIKTEIHVLDADEKVAQEIVDYLI